MPAPKRRRGAKRPKLPREPFETRTYASQTLGLGEEIETLAGSLEGTVTSLGLFYTTLKQAATG